MWDEDANDFGGHVSSEAELGSLGLGNSELMYGSFADPSICSNGSWGGPEFNYQQLQEQPTSDDLHLHHQLPSLQQEEDEAATAVACIEAGTTADTTITNESVQHHQQYYAQPPDAPTPQQCIIGVPELSSWWSPDSQAMANGVPQTQQQQHQVHHHPTESVSEREFIIVRKAKTATMGGLGGSAVIGWNGGASLSGTETAVVYECRICGRQCRWRSSISVHVRTHTGRKPYQCRVCHQRFADSSTRKKHEKKTHGCVIPSNKKAGGSEDQTTVGANLTPQQQPNHHHQQQQMQSRVNSPTCHLCFAMLHSEAELTKHLYEFHNQLMPNFADTFSEAADDVPVLTGSSGRIKPPLDDSNYSQKPGSGCWPDRILSEFDHPDQQSTFQPPQHEEQQLPQGIPLPSVPHRHAEELDQNIGAVDHHHGHDGWRMGGDAVSGSAAGGTGGGAGDHSDGVAHDPLYPYDIGCLGRDLHGIDSILEDGRLTSYNQHLEFDKLDW